MSRVISFDGSHHQLISVKSLSLLVNHTKPLICNALSLSINIFIYILRNPKKDYCLISILYILRNPEATLFFFLLLAFFTITTEACTDPDRYKVASSRRRKSSPRKGRRWRPWQYLAPPLEAVVPGRAAGGADAGVEDVRKSEKKNI